MTDPNESDERTPPRGTAAMAFVRWVLIALMAIVAVVSVAYSFGLLGGPTANAAAKVYYCPMHPQVVQDHPGECPICSMSLVPKTTDAQAQSKKEDGSSHSGHRHNPSDPYFCPMHPEETGDEPTDRCPLCEMKLEKRPAPSASAPTPKASPSSPSGEHAGHRHNAGDPYFCPMHPEETGDEASDRCPVCEMKLEKRATASEPAAAPAAPAEAAAADTRGVPGLVPVELTMDRVQMIGVRTARAVQEAMASELRTVGFVTADEAKLARVHARFSGWVEGLSVATTGQKVKRGQPLLSIYNVELLPVQQEFLAARRWNASQPAATTGDAPAITAPLEQDARTRLEIMGMSRAEIDRIAQTGKPVRAISVAAPINGYVVAKNVVQGAFVQPGTSLFEIADLSRVWVLADVYEHEIARMAVGQPASVELATHRGQRFEGKVGFVYPTMDASTRTLRVRVELENKDLKLRPGMYADVFVQVGEQQGVTVPREALVDTGEHQYVFIAKEGGRFEPRLVTAGGRTGDKVQIVRGLAEGETVVTTANFLIDSESRLRATIEAQPGAAATPHTGH